MNSNPNTPVAGLVERLRAELGQYPEVKDALAHIEQLEADKRALEGKLAFIEAEARRYAGFYPEASDGRNTFVIFADKIAASRECREGRGRG